MSENAQQQGPGRTGDGPTRWRGSAEPARRDGGAEPDVLLDVPEVSADAIRLAVDGLDADLSLRARLANLLQIDAGVRVHLQGVELDITGVHAEALLKVRLEKLMEILDRALSSIDRNPQIIDALSRTDTATIDDVNRSAQQLLQRGDQLSATAQRVTGATRGLRADVAGAGAQGATGGGGWAAGGGAQAGRGGGQAAGGAGEAGVGGGATDQLGQQVGAIGAVGDRTLRDQAGRAPGGTGGPGPGGGAAEQAGHGQQGRPGGRGAGLASGSGGGGEFGAAERARGRAEEMAGAGGPAQAGRGAERPEGDQGRRTEAAGTTGGGRPAEGKPEEPSGERPPTAMELAEQAGETLRQAGRSVWEAIQGGIAQRRDPKG